MKQQVLDDIRKNWALYVELYGNRIGDEGVKTLSEAMKCNRSVTSVDLVYNGVGDEGVKVLAEMLKGNKSVTSIDLSKNDIGDEGGKALAEMLEVNKSLIFVKMQDNKIGSDQIKIIDAALERNSAKGKVESNFTVLAVDQIKYDNPLLNHPKLLNQLSDKYGSGVLSKLIDFGTQFTASAESREELEALCGSESNFYPIVESMGCSAVLVSDI